MTQHHKTTSTVSNSPSSRLDEVKSESEKATRSLAENAKATARDAAEQARTHAAQTVETAKQKVAGEVSNISSALRKAADEAREGSPQERTFGQIAEGLADASDAIAKKDLGEMAHDLSEFARRNPLVFLGGAALIGFAATRFAKAGRQKPDYVLPAQPVRAAPSHPVTTGVPRQPHTGGLS